MKVVNRYTGLLAGLILAMAATPSQACSPDGYLASLKPFAGNFAIRNCAFAQGQLLSISTNTALFSLVGTLYGGDGRTTFGLPDTRGRSVVGPGTGPGLSTIFTGQKSGAENKSLSASNLAPHSHAASTTVTATATAHANKSRGNSGDPTGKTWASTSRKDIYSNETPNAVMSAAAITVAATAITTTSNAGSGTSFSIRDPYIGLYWLIQTAGLYPSRN